ncbi:MAG TPA: magnesium transporter [Tepidisphaeraceae bacterium]|nr:magnesium transporter [Tepidisphaeraceae bacterium]
MSERTPTTSSAQQPRTPAGGDGNGAAPPSGGDAQAGTPASAGAATAGATATATAPPKVSSAAQPSYLAHTIEAIPAPDGAQLLADLEPGAAAQVAEFLDPETAGDVLAEMEPVAAATVITDMEPPEAAMVLQEMDPDDRVDILAHVAPERREALLEEMDAREAAEVRHLRQYPPDSAGGIMTTEVTALPDSLTVQQAIEELRRLSEELEQMFYVYVIDRHGHLVGVLSMRDLILAKPDRRIRDIMHRNVTSVQATTDQEDVARLMRKYKYLAVPVTDARNHLVGLITVDDVVDVIQDEATEDVQRMAGAGAEERLTSPWFFSFKKRIWWLQVNLATAFAAAAVIAMFQDVIEEVAILAAYQTIVSGMGGNAGAQAMAVAIRGIALGEVDRSLLRRILWREFLVGLLSGLIIGATTGIIAAVFNYSEHGVLVGVVIFLALVINHVVACTSGVAIPFVMRWLGFDPAQSATIFATTVTDCGGFFATLGLAALALRFFHGS